MQHEQQPPVLSPDSHIGQEELIAIAASTLKAIETGTYEVDGSHIDLAEAVKYTNGHSEFYSEDSNLADWPTGGRGEIQSKALPIGVHKEGTSLKIQIAKCSVLIGARTLKKELQTAEGVSKTDNRVGVLNFASAEFPGGHFLTGSQAQEESIARSSTLYPSLRTEVAQQFYQTHKRDQKHGYYSHAMVYSPKTLLIKSDAGNWLPPVDVDVLTSCAVYATIVREYLHGIGSTDESEVDAVMKERMARVLYLFERQGVRNVILGSFGTGVFENRVKLVAGVWKELLEGRFKHSFDRVVFAILGQETIQTFQDVFA